MSKLKVFNILAVATFLLAACAAPATPTAAPTAVSANTSAPVSTTAPVATSGGAATVAPTTAAATVAPTAAGAATTAPTAVPTADLSKLPVVPRNQTVNLGWTIDTPVGTTNPWAGISTQQGQQFMFEPLAYYGIFASKSIPWLADSMTYNADFTQLTIKLNPMAAWSDGQPLTSDDVAFTFNGQLSNTKLSYNSYFTTYVKDWTTPDAQTVLLNFKIPAPRFAYEVLTFKFDTGIPIVPKHVLSSVPDVVAYAGGTDMPHSGPFSIVAWDANQKIFDLRPDWWAVKAGKEALPEVKRIVMVGIGGLVGSNMDIIAQRTDNNEFDATLDVRASLIDSEIKANPKVQSWTNGAEPNGYLDWWPNSLWMNTQLAPYSDPNIRRAMCDTVDRTQINTVLYSGASIATVYPFPLYPALQAFANSDAVKAAFTANASKAMQTMTADLTESSALMTAAGYAKNADGLWAKDGNTVNATIQTLGSIHTDIAPVLVEMLKTGGFDASANFGNDAYANMAAGKPGMYMFGHGASTVDPFAVLFLYDTKNSAPIGTTAGNNAFSRYSNPAYDKLVDEMAPLGADNPTFQADAAQAMGIYWKDTLDCPVIQWLHRIPYNNTYWTNWPSATNAVSGENGAFWAGTGMLVITQLKATNAK
jgi:peptide/nickel transport system substrate-binding protein